MLGDISIIHVILLVTTVIDDVLDKKLQKYF
jgi:hypothetical protein